MIRTPKSKRAKIMGVSHHFLLCISIRPNSLRNPLEWGSLAIFSKSSSWESFIRLSRLELTKVSALRFRLFNIYPKASFMRFTFHFCFSENLKNETKRRKQCIEKNRQNCPCDQSIEQEDDFVPDFPNQLIDILKNKA